jgi:hypothetical protein
VESLRPYFDEPDGIEDGLVKLKLLELLFDITHVNENVMRQLLQMKQQVRSNIFPNGDSGCDITHPYWKCH